jgi:hypothetical protein
MFWSSEQGIVLAVWLPFLFMLGIYYYCADSRDSFLLLNYQRLTKRPVNFSFAGRSAYLHHLYWLLISQSWKSRTPQQKFEVLKRAT